MNRAPHIAGSCVVCGSTDARGLCTTRLEGGAHVVVCGSHELMHRRSEAPASSIAALIAMAGERRQRDERRGEGGDALGDALSAAFANRDRSGIDRRSADQ